MWYVYLLVLHTINFFLFFFQWIHKEVGLFYHWHNIYAWWRCVDENQTLLFWHPFSRTQKMICMFQQIIVSYANGIQSSLFLLCVRGGWGEWWCTSKRNRALRTHGKVSSFCGMPTGRASAVIPNWGIIPNSGTLPYTYPSPPTCRLHGVSNPRASG